VVPTISNSISIISYNASILPSLSTIEVKASLYLVFHFSKSSVEIFLLAIKRVLKPVSACEYKSCYVFDKNSASVLSVNLFSIIESAPLHKSVTAPVAESFTITDILLRVELNSKT